MRIIKFSMKPDQGDKVEEVVEFGDDVTNEEIDTELGEWVFDRIDSWREEDE